jgi:hypothetical protein
VSPATAATDDHFLHVLFVDDVGAGAVAASDALLIDESAAIGTQLADWVVVFPRASAGATSLAYTVPTGGTYRHLVVGFEPGQGVSYSVDGAAAGTTEAGDGGCVLFALATGAGASVSIE